MIKKDLKRAVALTFSILFAISCSTIEQENESFEPTADALKSVWVCHNPFSEHHGDLCSRECLEPADSTRFCWLLSAADCVEPLELQWQEDNCHLLYREGF